MKVDFAPDTLILYSSLDAPWFFLILGVILFVGGLTLMKKIPQGFKGFAPILGCLLGLISGVVLVLGEGVEITLDKKKQELRVAHRRGFAGVATTTFAFNNFTHAEVLESLSLTGGLEFADVEEHTLHFMRSDNTPLVLGVFKDKKKLRKIIDRLRKIVPFETYLIARPDNVEDNFYKQFINQSNVQISYAYPVYLAMEDTTVVTPPTHELPRAESLSTIQDGKIRDLTWLNHKSIFWITIVDIIVFSLLLLLYRIVVISKNFSRLTISIYVFLVLSGIICGAITLATFIGRSHVKFEGTNLVYSTTLLGITAYENQVTKNDVMLISNNLTMDWDANLTILTPRGLTLLWRSQTESESSIAEEVKNAMLTPKAYRMKIDISPLSVRERLLLEEQLNLFKARE